MAYLTNWEKNVAARKGFSAPELKRMLLSEETRSGLKLTGEEF